MRAAYLEIIPDGSVPAEAKLVVFGRRKARWLENA